MKRFWIFAAAVAAVTLTQTLHAETQTWFGFQVGISGGTPPPVVFRTEPHTIVLNDVYVVDDDRCDDDVFRTSNVWWRLRGGYWYRASAWNGPWMAVDVRRVPERVLVVPARHWKHHPHGGRTVIVVKDGHDNGRHRGHGRGHGHGHHDD
jgi:hypothetical protein